MSTTGGRQTPVPVGFTLVADPSLRATAGGTVLTGGTPWHLIRLTQAGADRARRLLAGTAVADDADAALARRLLRAGLAHPRPPAGGGWDGDVVVPVRDRTAELECCLAALSLGAAVVVVDDGSVDAAAVAVVVEQHGARLVRLPVSRGPAAARNAGLAATDRATVAFVDSDVLASAETLGALADHLADPQVGAAAPRVLPAAGSAGLLSRFAADRSPLDLGPQPANVGPGGRLTFVPTTALVVRRAALDAVGGFDEELRYGEDVDLCWRLVDAGWTVRYDASVSVRHGEPAGWPAWFGRMFRYGSSAGPLARRHGRRLAGPPLIGLAAPGMLAARVRAGEIPADVARRLAVVSPLRTLLAVARWLVPLWWPALAVLALRRRGTRSGIAGAVGVPMAVEWRRRRPQLDPLRWGIAALADDAAYGAGIWWGAMRARTGWPLVPRWRGDAPASASDGRVGAHDEPGMPRRPQPAQDLDDV